MIRAVIAIAAVSAANVLLVAGPALSAPDLTHRQILERAAAAQQRSKVERPSAATVPADKDAQPKRIGPRANG